MDYTFKQDLEIGRSAEKLFAWCAEKEFNATNIVYNTSLDVTELRKWDLQYTNTDNNQVTFEIKNDLLSTSTGNFAIEFFGRTAPSGIDATTADFWVILSNCKFYIFKTSTLKRFIEANRFRQIMINNGTAWCYLVPIEKVKHLAKIINAQ